MVEKKEVMDWELALMAVSESVKGKQVEKEMEKKVKVTEMGKGVQGSELETCNSSWSCKNCNTHFHWG